MKKFFPHGTLSSYTMWYLSTMLTKSLYTQFSHKTIHHDSVLVAVFAAYAARLSDTYSFDVGYIWSNPEQSQQDDSHLSRAILRFAFDATWTFAQVVDAVQQQIMQVQQQSDSDIQTEEIIPLSLPLVPSLQYQGQEPSAPPIAVAHINLDDDIAFVPHAETLITFVVSSEKPYCLFNEALLDQDEGMQRFFSHFETFIHHLSTHPDDALSTISLLTEAEYQQLIFEWNNTHTEYPRNLCIHQLIESQVARTPDKVAVVFENQYLTYRELNQRANRLAHQLIAVGVRPDVLVGIYVERSIDIAVGLLAILKAGGAYVPLDPNYPQERVALMLEDSQLAFVVTQQRLMAHISQQVPHVVCIDTEPEHTCSVDNPNIRVTSENLAYVIYTSGSTGTPNGVMIRHNSLVNHCIAFARACELQPDERMLQFSTINFDASIEEIFPTWYIGATIVIRSDYVISSFSTFQEFLRQQRVTAIDLPTSFWHAWVEHLEHTQESFPETVRIVIIGGEQVLAKHYVMWEQLVDNRVRWYNSYGPTETTIAPTLYKPNGSFDNFQQGVVPIGKPIDNARLYVLDTHLQPVPIGVPGELYVGGDGIAAGYLNRPELTAKRFLPDPFVGEPGSRMYKTGDLVQYLPDGNVEFLGRVDYQVKVRGFRIEPSEIETILSQHPDVYQTVVTVREDQPGQKKLVAYVVAGPKSKTKPVILRDFLSENLPNYLIPSSFVVMDSFPLTPSGKIDRRALPTPKIVEWATNYPYTAPRNPTEKIIADTWAEVLGLDQVGIYDTFASMGGESLLAIQIISRLRMLFQIDIPLRLFFDNATIVDLAQYIEQNQTPAEMPNDIRLAPITPVARDRDLPMSFAQERLWFIYQFDSQSMAYSSPAAIRFQGNLNIEALRQSLQDIVQRHESLRTTFAVRNGQPIQIITPQLAVDLPVQDIQSLPATQREAKAERLMYATLHQPFNLETGPLIRATVIRLADDDHIFAINIHHIVTDGWSYGVFYRELVELYANYTTGQHTILPELPIQYADYAVWQRQILQGTLLQEYLDYWINLLSGIPDKHQLPTDRPRSPSPSLEGATYRRVLPQTIVDQLTLLCQQEGGTLFMGLLTAFAVLLCRYSGQTDMPIGSPVVERNRSELENLIGFLVNNVVFRVRIDGNPSFRELFHSVREMALGVYAHQELPFEQIVEALNPPRDVSYQPIFQLSLAMELEPLYGLDLPEVRGQHLEVTTGGAWFDLLLLLEKRSEGLVGAWEYATDLFDETTIVRMSQNLEELLYGIVENPDQPVFQLPLLSADEQRRILFAWNDTQAEYSDHHTIHQLFEAQVVRTPDAIALCFEDNSLTYQQLNEQANQLAHMLQREGVGPDTLVGISVERSFDMIVGIFGILKAGGAYVPIDPTYPAERILFMCQDSGVSLLLSQKHLAHVLPSSLEHIFFLDDRSDTLANESKENLSVPVRPNHLAYVIYTSGSTGRPKGVLIEHQGVCNMAEAVIEKLRLTTNSRVLQFASLSFDSSVSEIFSVLAVGAILDLGEPGPRIVGREFFDLLNRREITAITFPPTMLASLPIEPLPTMETIVVAGEACPTSLVQQWAGNYHIINGYGPTETTVYATFAVCNPDSSAPPPIGTPFQNMQTYILDEQMQPVPIGVLGELYIGGVGVARGYLNRPELTTERFVPNPFSSDTNARLYRTGDLTRYLPDGNIAFEGRIDRQIKLRGFRIEIGEIEASLRQHPAVQNVVVMLREDTPGDKRIGAYIQPKSQQKIAHTEMRSFLQRTLPDFMIPSFFVVLETFPVAPMGKIDYHALPAPDTARPDIEQAYVSPQTTLEQTLALIWAETLSLDQVGMHDNFFELGGHSLQITQLVARMREETGYPIAVKDIFRCPTVAELATMVQQEYTSPAVPIASVVADTACRVKLPYKPDTEGSQQSPYLKVEHRPFLSLLATGALQPVDAVALSYLPLADMSMADLVQTDIGREEMIAEWCDAMPMFDEYYETEHGRIANITLPFFDDQMYQDKEGLLAATTYSLRLARHIGARVVALTGLIPSATAYGQDIVAACADDEEDLPHVSTGHATTTAAVALSIKRILEESGRDIASERVGFLGLGSIGTTSLRLMLRCFEHPPYIVLCDVYNKREEMETLKQTLITMDGFKGSIDIVESAGQIPELFYTASLIVGATNVPDILDIDKLQSGTLIVDDSGPHCFNTLKAIERFETHHDILFTEGGAISSSHAIYAVKYLPRIAEKRLPVSLRQTYARHNPYTIMGCTLSGLLSMRFPELSPTIGYVDAATSYQHYTTLLKMGYYGADLHCEGYVLPEEHIAQFRHHTGRWR